MGFTFAGLHSDQFRLKIMNITRPLTSGITTRTVKVPGRPGVYDMGIEVDELQISIDILLISRDLREIREQVRQIAAWLRNNDQLGKLIFDDEPDKYYMARMMDKTELEEVAWTGRGTIMFFAPDPMAYAVNDDQFTTTENKLTFQRKGTASSKPLLEIVGESSDMLSGFSIQMNDSQMNVIGSLAVHESLIIDSFYQTAYLVKADGTKKSVLDRLDRFDFPVTRPQAENQLTVEPIGNAHVNQLKIECRSCWY